jgi:hypothetical protein
MRHTLSANLFNQLRNQARPTGLVAGTNPGTIVSMKVLMELNPVAPVRIVLESFLPPIDRSAITIAEENSYEPAGKVSCSFPQIRAFPRPRGALHLKCVTKEVVEFLQRFHEKKVERVPDRAAPVRISSEQAAIRFGRLIRDSVFMSVDSQYVRVLAVKL